LKTAPTFHGIPLSGEVYPYDPAAVVPQITSEEFAALLRPLIGHQDVKRFGWRQYVPYFNDGEPCEFGAHSVWVQTVADVDAEDPDDFDSDALEVGNYHPTMGTKWWDDVTNRWVTKPMGLYPEVNALAEALKKAVESGAADNVLRAAFGDHAVITVTAEGIDVEWYDHD
jgi:hypothetical protein